MCHVVTIETIWMLLEHLTAQIKIPFKGGLIVDRVLRLHKHSVVGSWCVVEGVMGSGGVLLVEDFVMVVGVIPLVMFLVCDVSRISRLHLMGFVLAHILIVVNVVALECGIVYRDIGDFGGRCWEGV